MAALVVQADINQVPAGICSIRVQFLDATGTVMDEADSGPIDVPAGEAVGVDVQVPRVHLRQRGVGKVRKATLPIR